jgi:hypothetical protein
MKLVSIKQCEDPQSIKVGNALMSGCAGRDMYGQSKDGLERATALRHNSSAWAESMQLSSHTESRESWTNFLPQWRPPV